MEMPVKSMSMKLKNKLKERWKRKILIEDWVKKLYGVQTAHPGKQAYIQAGEIPPAILRAMEKEGLVTMEDKHPVLTDKGKQLAEKLIRRHRIYEKYLAEKTGFHSRDWHRLAEKAEHQLDDTALSQIEKELGNPLFDPHGDPLAPEAIAKVGMDGKALAETTGSFTARILHLEDEPEDIFKNITEKGIYPGAIVKAEQLPGGQYLLKFEGVTVHITPEESRYIQVKLVDEKLWDPQVVRLSVLKPGEKAEIVKLAGDLRGLARQRLLDLGFVRGSVVKAYLKAPLGEPVAYVVKDAVIALRKEQSDKILVKKL